MVETLPVRLESTDLAVSTRALSKWYGWRRALNNVALQVPTNAVYLLVGPNGAGKSTAIKILLDLLRPSGGTAEVLGMNAQLHPALVHANVGYVPELLTWGYGWMTVGRLLQHHARYYPTWDDAYAKHLQKKFELELDQKVGSLSKGQGRRVHLAMALAHRPPLLILDEPTDGLDPVMRNETLGVLIDHMSDTPTTMMMCTHHESEVEKLADHIGVLRNGELCAQMPLDTLRGGLRRYRAEIPANWKGKTLFGEAVLRRTTTESTMDWTVWGEESRISYELASTGAMVHECLPLTLHDATVALLTPNRTNR
jgi:ABC-2 type transport system ATP-binding protein